METEVWSKFSSRFGHFGNPFSLRAIAVSQDGAQKGQRRERDPGHVGPDVHDSPLYSQKTVPFVERVNKIEQDLGAMNGKLDLIIASMQNEVAWDEVKPRGSAKKKPTKPCHKPRSPSSSSPSSSSSADQKEGETKYFECKKFAPKDHKFKRSAEIVHVCVKTLEKVINDPVGT